MSIAAWTAAGSTLCRTPAATGIARNARRAWLRTGWGSKWGGCCDPVLSCGLHAAARVEPAGGAQPARPLQPALPCGQSDAARLRRAALPGANRDYLRLAHLEPEPR